MRRRQLIRVTFILTTTLDLALAPARLGFGPFASTALSIVLVTWDEFSR